ncbi:hypothetical protein [Clostridium sp. MD294]|uniref:hypothetical protein n=1 Tax=Clostridium sp. MD294 TaxID=97138 RepID=UPI0002C951DC|nr:hypothetical protein [Clostridium sp. MD294]NDO45765.1 hypothetical protein [Clostridium sp. MD294]USF30580.1 hypothetical protein C820_002022 [Clostridium sp. MD294]
MYCSSCGKEGSGKYCAECGGLLIEGEQEKKQYIQPPRKPLETDVSEYINNHSINITEIMEHYEKNKEYGIEVLAYYSDISLQEAEAYINNKIYKQSQPKRTLFNILKRNLIGNKKPKENEENRKNNIFPFYPQKPRPRVKTDFLEVDDKNVVTFRSIDMMFKGTLVKKSKNNKYVMAIGSYGKKVAVDCYVFFNRERPLYKVITNSPFKEAYVTNTGAFSLLTVDGKFYLYDIGQKEAALVEMEEEERQIITSYFCELFTILLYKKEGRYFLSIYDTQKGNFIYKKYFDIDSDQISQSTIQVTNNAIEWKFPCGLFLQYDFRGNATNIQEEKSTLNRLYYPIAYVNNAVDKIEMLRKDETLLEARIREIRALFELAIEKVGDMYWCYDNYACFEAEFGDIVLAKKYLLKAENSQNNRNADLYKICGKFALKRDKKEYALEFFEKSIRFKVDTETIELYKTLKQELIEKEAEKKQSKKLSSLFKKEKEENATIKEKENEKHKENENNKQKEENKKEKKKTSKKSLMETFLPEDVLEEEIKTEQTQLQQEEILLQQEPEFQVQEEIPLHQELSLDKNIENNTEQRNNTELSDFEKRRKAREEMRSRNRKMRKSGQKAEE